MILEVVYLDEWQTRRPRDGRPCSRGGLSGSGGQKPFAAQAVERGLFGVLLAAALSSSGEDRRQLLRASQRSPGPRHGEYFCHDF